MRACTRVRARRAPRTSPTPTRHDAAPPGERIARALLKDDLIACANLVPGVTSLYRWKGKVQRDAEVMMLLKTRASLLEPLTEAVREAHPYDQPEVVAVPVAGGSEGYLRWVAESTAEAAEADAAAEAIYAAGLGAERGGPYHRSDSSG